MALPKRNNHRDRMARIMAVSSTWTAKPMRTRLNPFITDFDRYWAERLGGAAPAKETRLVTTAVTEGALAPAVAEAAKEGLSKGDKAKITKIDREINEILAARKGRKGAPPAAEKQKLADLRAKKAAILGEAPAPTPAQTAAAVVKEAAKVTETAANNAADSVESIRLNIKAIEDYYAERGSKPGRPKAGFGKDDLKALKDKLAAAEAAAGAAAIAADTVKDIADSAGVAVETKPRRKPGPKPGSKPGRKPASTAAAAEEAKDLTGVAVEAAREAQAHAEDVADEVDAAGNAEGVDLPVVDSVPEPLVQAGGVDSDAAKIAALTALLEAEDAKATPAQAVEAVKGVSPIPEDDEDEDPFAKIKQAMEQARKNPRRNSSDALPPVLKGYLVGQFKQMDPTLTDKQAESLFDFTNKSLNAIGVSRGTKTAAEYSAQLVGLISQYFNSILKQWRKQQAAASAPAPVQDEDEDTSDEDTDPGFDVEAADRLIRSLIDKEIEALLGTRANRSRSNFGRRNRF